MDGKRQQDDAFLREWSIPEEDRHKYTSLAVGRGVSMVSIAQRDLS
jgi:hypothetical protein